jgi:dihydrofolate synthase/folylpolyglutamate synthase
VVCGDRQVPDSLISVAVAFNAPLYMLGHDFEYKQVDGTWNWKGVLTRRTGLPAPGLMGRFQLDNAAAVLMVLELLREQIPVSQADVRLGLSRVRLPGRFQVFEGPVLTILDVAHNPQAARELAGQLRTTPCSGQTHGLCAMLKDKDHAAVMASLADTVDHWHLCGLDIARGATALELAAVISQLDVSGSIEVHDTIQHGFDAMGSAARSGDRLVVFGSFYTVAAVLKMGIAPN